MSDILDKKIKNPKTNRDIKVSTALSYKNNEKQQAAYKAVLKYLQSKELSDEDKNAISTQNKLTVPQTKQKQSRKDSNQNINLTTNDLTKKKRAKITKLPEFQKELRDIDKFKADKKQYKLDGLEIKLDDSLPLPKKYKQMFELMVNYGDFKSEKPGDYGLDEFGAGTPESLIGLVTVGIFACLLTQEQADLLYNTIKSKYGKDLEKKALKFSWITAAYKGRKAVSTLLGDKQIVGVISDTKELYEAVGILKSGRSTDITFLLNNGSKMLTSLKKSEANRILNTTVTQVINDDKPSKDLDKKQQQVMTDYYNKNKQSIDKHILKFPEILAKLNNRSDISTAKSKYAKKLLAAIINKHSEQHNQQLADNYKDFQKEFVNVLNKNKDTILDNLGDKLFFKEIFDLSEVMIVGDVAVNKDILSKTLGCNNYELMKLKMKFDKDLTCNGIKIASYKVRQKGKYYSTMVFLLDFHKELFMKLKLNQRA